MALPVFRAAGAKSAGTTAAVTVAAPTGVATGDLEILIAETLDTATVSITNDGGGAWTAMTGSPVSVTNGERLYVWWRIRAGGDGSPQVTASADHVDAARLAYQAGTFDTSDPFEIETTSSEATSDTSFSWAPGTTTGGADRLVLVISSIRRDSNTASVPVCTNASLSALNSRANYCTNSGLGGGFGVTEGAKAAAGTIGTFACTYAAASPKSYISFAIKPVAIVDHALSFSLPFSLTITTALQPAEHPLAFAMPLGLTIDTALQPTEHVLAFSMPLGLSINTALQPTEHVLAFDFSLGWQMSTDLVTVVEHALAFAMPLGLTQDTALSAEHFLSFAMGLGLQIDSALTHEAFIAFLQDLGPSIDSALVRETFAAFDFPLALGIQTNLTVSEDHALAFSMPLGFDISTNLGTGNDYGPPPGGLHGRPGTTGRPSGRGSSGRGPSGRGQAPLPPRIERRDEAEELIHLLAEL